MENTHTERRKFRMSWDEFTGLLKKWQEIKIPTYTSYEEASGIYASFRSLKELHLSRALSYQGRKEGVEKSIEGLRFFCGFPGMAIDQSAARKISRKRGGVRPQAKWQLLNVFYDEQGAIILPKKEVEFDIQLAENLLEEHNKQVEEKKRNDKANKDDKNTSRSIQREEPTSKE